MAMPHSRATNSPLMYVYEQMTMTMAAAAQIKSTVNMMPRQTKTPKGSVPRVPHSVAFPAGRTSAHRIPIAAGEQGGLWERTWLTSPFSFVSHATPLFSLSLLLVRPPPPPPAPSPPPPRCLARLAAHPALLLLPRPPLWITEVAQRAGELPGGSAEQPLIAHTRLRCRQQQVLESTSSQTSKCDKKLVASKRQQQQKQVDVEARAVHRKRRVSTSAWLVGSDPSDLQAPVSEPLGTSTVLMEHGETT